MCTRGITWPCWLSIWLPATNNSQLGSWRKKLSPRRRKTAKSLKSSPPTRWQEEDAKLARKQSPTAEAAGLLCCKFGKKTVSHSGGRKLAERTSTSATDALHVRGHFRTSHLYSFFPLPLLFIHRSPMISAQRLIINTSSFITWQALHMQGTWCVSVR